MATPRKTAPKKTTSAKTAETGAAQRSASAWRSKSRVEHQIEVPSGNIALVRRPGPGMFLQGGAIPDTLTPLVSEAIREKQGLPPEKMTEMAKDPNQITKVLGMIDSALLSIIVEPTVRADPKCERPTPAEFSKFKDVPHDHMEGGEVCDEPAWAEIHLDMKLPNSHVFIPGEKLSEEDREAMAEANPDDDFMYMSEVDLQDKLFLFNFAIGGSSDLERFRTEHRELVDSVHAGDDRPNATE